MANKEVSEKKKKDKNDPCIVNNHYQQKEK